MDTDGFLDGMGLWCGGLVLGWETSLNGAGPAGWLRESGSRLPHSKAFGWLVGRGRVRSLAVPGLFGGLVGALRAQREL